MAPGNESTANKYPTFRDDLVMSGYKWLDGKRLDDNAEGLWRIHDKLYDLTEFIHRHPGGAEWLELTKGVDITEPFETHHLTLKAERLLPKYYVREASMPRNYKMTFKEDGFYRTLKRNVAPKIEGLDKSPLFISKIILDSMLALTFLSAIFAVKLNNFYIAIASGFFLALTANISHNFSHQRDNWRMYCFNLTLISYRDWRISHILSHHLYTNSYYDLEITFFQPWLKWIPEPKLWIQRFGSWLISPIVYFLSFSIRYIASIITAFQSEKNTLALDDLLPFTLPLAMFLFGKNDLSSVLTMWIFIVFFGSFFFSSIAINAGHHHPEISHEGDELPQNMDFGVLQLNTVIDRLDAKSNQFMVLTNFGEHVLHHMFPTLDHGLLPQLNDTFLETCREFEVQMTVYPWYNLVAGQFLQLAKVKTSKLSDVANLKAL